MITWGELSESWCSYHYLILKFLYSFVFIYVLVIIWLPLGFSFNMWDLVSSLGIKPGPAWELRVSLSTTRAALFLFLIWDFTQFLVFLRLALFQDIVII